MELYLDLEALFLAAAFFSQVLRGLWYLLRGCPYRSIRAVRGPSQGLYWLVTVPGAAAIAAAVVFLPSWALDLRPSWVVLGALAVILVPLAALGGESALGGMSKRG